MFYDTRSEHRSHGILWAKLNEVCKWINNGNDPKISIYRISVYSFWARNCLTRFLPMGSKTFSIRFYRRKTGIPINGLVWMGDKEFMQNQITEKNCCRLSIISNSRSALWILKTELEIIAGIRQHFSADEIEIRLDANGGFTPEDALKKLEKLAVYHIIPIDNLSNKDNCTHWLIFANIHLYQ